MNTRRTLAIALLVCATTAYARAESPDAVPQARAHFQAGLLRAQQGDLVSALREFEAAYAIRPHFSVLYNIGLTRSAIGRPVEAVAAFERYLADGGAQIAEARRQEVQALLASNRKRIGVLKLAVDAADQLRLWLDGELVPSEQMNQSIAIREGEHTLVYSNGSGFPEARTVSVTGAATTEVTVRPSHDVRQAPATAQLAISCAVPDVRVEIAGMTRAKTPLEAPLLVPAGHSTITFTRLGYRFRSQSVTTKADALTKVACIELAPPPLLPSLAARLELRTVPPDAETLVDGRRFLGAAMPAGLHYLQVRHDGFLPEERLIRIEAGQAFLYDSRLKPTPAMAERQRRSKSARRSAGLVAGGLGGALLAAGIGIYAWNTGRYRDWRDERAQSSADHNLAAATSIQRADDASLGLMVLGAGLALGGSWLLFHDE
jgi:hypothetical protein